MWNKFQMLRCQLPSLYLNFSFFSCSNLFFLSCGLFASVTPPNIFFSPHRPRHFNFLPQTPDKPANALEIVKGQFGFVAIPFFHYVFFAERVFFAQQVSGAKPHAQVRRTEGFGGCKPKCIGKQKPQGTLYFGLIVQGMASLLSIFSGFKCRG